MSMILLLVSTSTLTGCSPNKRCVPSSWPIGPHQTRLLQSHCDACVKLRLDLCPGQMVKHW